MFKVFSWVIQHKARIFDIWIWPQVWSKLFIMLSLMKLSIHTCNDLQRLNSSTILASIKIPNQLQVFYITLYLQTHCILFQSNRRLSSNILLLPQPHSWTTPQIPPSVHLLLQLTKWSGLPHGHERIKYRTKDMAVVFLSRSVSWGIQRAFGFETVLMRQTP